MFSLICDRWLTVNYRRLRVQPIPGVLDSADMTFGCGCEAGPIVNLRGGGWGLALALLGWTCSEPLRRGWREDAAAQAGRMLRPAYLGRQHNLALKSFNQYPSPRHLTPQQRETCRLTLPIGTPAEGRHTHTP